MQREVDVCSSSVPVGLCPSEWSSKPYLAYHRLKQQKPFRALTRG